MSLPEFAMLSPRLQIEQSWLLCGQLFFAALLGVTIVLAIPSSVRDQIPSNIKPSIRSIVKNRDRILLFCAAIGIINYVGLILLYLLVPEFADPAEANVASVAWLVRNGASLYPLLDAAERYINNYGACLYLIQGFFLSVLSPNIWSIKLAGCLAGCGSLWLNFLLFRKQLNWQSAIGLSAVTSLGFLALTSGSGLFASSFWVRPDSFLLLCTSLAMYGAAYGDRRGAVWGSAIALGVATNLKINAVLHFLPIYALVLQRFGFFSVFISTVGAGFTAIAPFLLFPNVSLPNYLTWLRQVGQKGINPPQITKNLLWMAYMSLPIAIISFRLAGISVYKFKTWLRHHSLFGLILLPCIVLTALMGATRGALENNMLPFLPLFSYLSADALETISSMTQADDYSASKRVLYIDRISVCGAIAFILSLVLTVHSTESDFIARIARSPGQFIVEDLRSFLQTHQRVGMGYGSSYPLATYRPILTFAKQPYLLDSASLMEMQASGYDNTPPKTIEAMKTCQTKFWLIPKGEKPFDVYSYYPPLQKLFSEKFRKEFDRAYKRQESTRFFDVWSCKK